MCLENIKKKKKSQSVEKRRKQTENEERVAEFSLTHLFKMHSLSAYYVSNTVLDSRNRRVKRQLLSPRLTINKYI